MAKQKTYKGQRLIEALRDAITDSGRTRYAIAKEADVPFSALNRFVAKERDLQLKTAAAVAEVLGLELVHSKTKGR